MTDAYDASVNSAPFEGPEKLLEIWFAPSPAHVLGASTNVNDRVGLRKVPRAAWEDMLAIVKCQVLSVVEGEEIDAYLLSESSLFISAHRLILKTCGTTLNLYGLPRILDIARSVGFPNVYRCFYSRKSFFFPERQKGPHREWKDEVGYLDGIFKNGAAYTVGKVNGDHWLLYMTRGDEASDASPITPAQPLSEDKESPEDDAPVGENPESSPPSHSHGGVDYTIEILMTHLDPTTSSVFVFGDAADDSADLAPSTRAQALSTAIGISDLFPSHLTTLDAFAFTPCGYSSNALIKWSEAPPAPGEPKLSGEGYYTIHVTPEDGWSYASFECNVPLPARRTEQEGDMPDLRTLVRRVVDIFRPGRISLTLFISSEDNEEAEEERGISAIEAAQRAFRAALTRAPGADGRIYKRTDKINYEFGDYDLAFATFEITLVACGSR
ncbi:S-adenosylmethionine decarboxylase [Vararia minispora EC-137]|uniref:S-adenosylmethionine decarboxylase n=1 Tax=Vararia minispora EC-137 TaxID=1314806 RepID=A0ACB8QG12_9AGAM|nr:S-adenosylmethionine decarboxylase [Vararia minispora EC-137]